MAKDVNWQYRSLLKETAIKDKYIKALEEENQRFRAALEMLKLECNGIAKQALQHKEGE